MGGLRFSDFDIQHAHKPETRIVCFSNETSGILEKSLMLRL